MAVWARLQCLLGRTRTTTPCISKPWPRSLADASYEELSAQGGMWEGSDESLGAVEASRQRRGRPASVERDKLDAHLL